MARYVVVWGYATRDSYKVEVETAESIIEAERLAGQLHGVVVPYDNIDGLIEKLEEAKRR